MGSHTFFVSTTSLYSEYRFQSRLICTPLFMKCKCCYSLFEKVKWSFFHDLGLLSGGNCAKQLQGDSWRVRLRRNTWEAPADMCNRKDYLRNTWEIPADICNRKDYKDWHRVAKLAMLIQFQRCCAQRFLLNANLVLTRVKNLSLRLWPPFCKKYLRRNKCYWKRTVVDCCHLQFVNVIALSWD